MINAKTYGYGTLPNTIFDLFMYGREQAAKLGEDKVYDYSLGNPSIPSPAKVTETITRLINESDTVSLFGYSPAAGLPDVREAIAANLRKRFASDAAGSELFLTCGCGPALASVARTLTESPESNFVVFAPFFPEYKLLFSAGGGEVRIVEPDIPDFQIDLDALDKAVDQNTTAVVINSPNNPSGVVYTRETIEKLAEYLRGKEAEYGHPVYIVADEPYRELIYGDAEIVFIPEIYDDTIVCYSWSKSLSLPGERIGYVYVPSKCADGKKIYAGVAGSTRESGEVCAPVLAQRVVRECVDCMPDLAMYDKNRTELYEGLTGIGYECAKPGGAFYMFLKAPNGDDKAFSEAAKLEENILIVPGTGFGCPGYLRIAYCVRNEVISRSMPGFRRLFEKYSSK